MASSMALMKRKWDHGGGAWWVAFSLISGGGISSTADFEIARLAGY